MFRRFVYFIGTLAVLGIGSHIYTNRVAVGKAAISVGSGILIMGGFLIISLFAFLGQASSGNLTRSMWGSTITHSFFGPRNLIIATVLCLLATIITMFLLK